MPRQSPYTPRKCIDPWPAGKAVAGVPEPWATKAADTAAWVILMEARLKANHTNVSALARHMGVARSSLDRLLRGESWPTFDLLTSMADAMHYWEIWADLARKRRR